MTDFSIMCDCATFHDIWLALHGLGYPEDACTMIGDLVQNLVHLLGLCNGAWFVC